ncbi:histidine phosphatase [Mycobacterium sp. 1100029.7]|nr:histidine phosphatase [Mycobacterium sp. 1100029.7]
MTAVVRLTLVSHAMTDAMATTRFPDDEPLNELGRRQAEGAAGLDVSGAHHLAGPEQRTRETALLLGLNATTEPRLADLDYGRLRGQTLADLTTDDLHVWLTEPATAPHGGESIVDLTERVGRWLTSLIDGPARTVAVTHPAVVRAAILVALDASPKSFWRIDIGPVSSTTLHHRDGRWTLRLL